MELPSTTERVTGDTAPEVNAQILATTLENVRRWGARPADVARRLEALEREWDIERTLEANAASLALLGVVLGFTVDRRFFVVPGVVAAFLLQHALEGWCPPLPIFRRLGVRTQREIDHERFALKALRGDFERLAGGGSGGTGDARAALEAARS